MNVKIQTAFKFCSDFILFFRQCRISEIVIILQSLLHQAKPKFNATYNLKDACVKSIPKSPFNLHSQKDVKYILLKDKHHKNAKEKKISEKKIKDKIIKYKKIFFK